MEVVESYYLQRAPTKTLIEVIRQLVPNWPSIEAQELLCCEIIRKYEKFLPSQKWFCHLLKLIESDVTESELQNVDDDNYGMSDSIMEIIIESKSVYFVNSNAQVGNEVDPAYVVYSDIQRERLTPLRVLRSHNQVGTRIWQAGVYLAHVLQLCADEIADLTLLELGSGTGITGLLLANALSSTETKPKKIIMTDFDDAVVDNMNYNANSESLRCCRSGVEIKKFDWRLLDSESDSDLRDGICKVNSEIGTNLEDIHSSNTNSGVDTFESIVPPDVNVLFAADCTYAEDCCYLLIKIFEKFLKSDDMNIPIDISQSPADGFDLLSNLKKMRQKYVLIACTVRNLDTYQHFLNLLDSSPILSKINLTIWASDLISRSFVTIPSDQRVCPLYHYENIDAVKLWCIYRKL